MTIDARIDRFDPGMDDLPKLNGVRGFTRSRVQCTDFNLLDSMIDV